MLRLILIGLALAASPALAAPSAMVAMPVSGGPGASGPGGFGSGFAGEPGWGPGSRPDQRSWHRDDGRRGRRHRDSRTQGYGYGFWGPGVTGGNYPVYADGGFFSDGDASRTPGGVAYDYDRGYPYDHYRGRAALPLSGGSPFPDEPLGCSVKWVPGDGGRVPVRICRR